MAKKVNPLEQIWWVTWTCGHRALIEETLPKCSWKNTLLIDYSCPQGTGDWASKRTKATVLRVDAPRLVDGTPIVSRARALNVALNHLSTEWVLLADPQLYPTADTRDAVLQAASTHGDVLLVPGAPTPATLGVVVARAATLLWCGGYLQAYVGHGAESVDLRLRALQQGVTIVPCDVPVGVATGHRVKLFGSQGLLESRFVELTGYGAKMFASVDRPRAQLLGLLV